MTPKKNFDPVELGLQQLEKELSDPRYFSNHHVTDPDVEKSLRMWIKLKDTLTLRLKEAGKTARTTPEDRQNQRKALIAQLIAKIEALTPISR